MLPDKAKFVVCSIIDLAVSFWMKHLVIGQLQKLDKSSAFHWSTSRSQTFLLLAVPRRLFCFGSLVILDVARCYLWLFTLYINIKIGKIVVKC